MSIHPASLTKEPCRDPDYADNYRAIWFNEMVYSYIKSNLEWETCPMMVCPVSGKLMYMQHHLPLCWISINDEEVDEAYVRFLMEKEMLGAFDETFNIKG